MARRRLETLTEQMFYVLLSLEEEDVSGSGYVVDTLVAALWCLPMLFRDRD